MLIFKNKINIRLNLESHIQLEEIRRENRAEAPREWMAKSKMFKDTPFPIFFPSSSLARDLSSAIFWLEEVMYSMKLMN